MTVSTDDNDDTGHGDPEKAEGVAGVLKSQGVHIPIKIIKGPPAEGPFQ